MCFSWTRLPIGHNGSIESVENIIQDRLSDLLVYLLLSAIHVKYVIVHEGDFLRFIVFYYELGSFAYTVIDVWVDC
jgi:hypothetical protein